ncbi:hypothetical protein HCJ66_10250 [Listeria sp. FSL L7-1582]|uniref:hypothetical protein n=1 Tax=Listeria portnoyi TaxID=2713504 RepID=UPI00164D47FF|nr:hypothetical protein [Listeria portnoyi]MBC6309922.1 hypothetical protein [Listeria portnoyi]
MTIMCAGMVLQPIESKATENNEEVLHSDDETKLVQENKNKFIVSDKETGEETRIVLDKEHTGAEIIYEDGETASVEYNIVEENGTEIVTTIIDGEEVATTEIGPVEYVNDTKPLLKASYGMKLVTTRKVTATINKVNRVSANVVMIGLGLVPGLGYAVAAFALTGYLVSEFAGKKAYVIIKQYADNWNYRNDAWIYKDSGYKKLLEIQKGMLKRHFS